MKIKGKRYRKLMLELLVSNLIASRKLYEYILMPHTKEDSEAVIPKAVQFQKDLNNSIQEAIDKIYKSQGDISINDILGKET